MSQPVNGGRACPVCFQTGEDCHCGVTCFMCGHTGPFYLAAHGTTPVCADEFACEVRCLPQRLTDLAEAYAEARLYHRMYRDWFAMHQLYKTGPPAWPGPEKMLGWEELLQRIAETAETKQEEAAELYERFESIRDRIH